MEFLFAIVIVVFAAGGLGLGLALGRREPRTACDCLARLGARPCAGCPHRKDGGDG